MAHPLIVIEAAVILGIALGCGAVWLGFMYGGDTLVAW